MRRVDLSRKTLERVLVSMRGLPIQEAAKRLDVSRQTLDRQLRKHGLAWPRGSTAPAGLRGIDTSPEWTRKLVAWAKEQRLTKVQAAEKAGIHVNTLHRILRQHGVSWWRAKHRKRSEELPRPWEDEYEDEEDT